MLEFRDKNFNDVVLGSPLPVLVDFWASWCLPCKAVEPVIEELASEYMEEILVGKINVDRNPITAQKYKVLGLPTFIIFHNGSEIARSVASLSRNQLQKLVNENLKEIKKREA